ncbi:NAD-dependent epimerase/dehydratase family protein [Roseobacteraceae bacterium NS-SX3]
MKVLILGGTGSVGTAVTHELARQGHAVTALSRSAKAPRSRFGAALPPAGRWCSATALPAPAGCCWRRRS